MSSVNAFLFGFTNMFNANIINATSLKDRKALTKDFYERSQNLRKQSNEKYNAKIKEFTKR